MKKLEISNMFLSESLKILIEVEFQLKDYPRGIENSLNKTKTKCCVLKTAMQKRKLHYFQFVIDLIFFIHLLQQKIIKCLYSYLMSNYYTTNVQYYCFLIFLNKIYNTYRDLHTRIILNIKNIKY